MEDKQVELSTDASNSDKKPDDSEMLPESKSTKSLAGQKKSKESDIVQKESPQSNCHKPTRKPSLLPPNTTSRTNQQLQGKEINICLK